MLDAHTRTWVLAAITAALLGCTQPIGSDGDVGGAAAPLAASSFVDHGPVPILENDAPFAIAVDRNGDPGIVSCEVTGEWPEQHSTVRYHRWNGSSWSAEVVADIGDKALSCYPRIAFDRSGQPHILARNATTTVDHDAGDDAGELACEAACVEECTGWGIPPEQCNWCPDRCEDDIIPHEDAGLYYATRRPGGTWTVEQLSSERGVDADLAIDDHGRSHVLFYPMADDFDETSATGPIVYFTRGRRGWRAYDTGVASDLYADLFSISRMRVTDGPFPRVHVALVEGGEDDVRVVHLSGRGHHWAVEQTGLPVTSELGPPTPSLALGAWGSVYIAATGADTTLVTQRNAWGRYRALPPVEHRIEMSFSPPFFLDGCGILHLWDPETSSGVRWNGREWTVEDLSDQVGSRLYFTGTVVADDTIHTYANFFESSGDFTDWRYTTVELE